MEKTFSFARLSEAITRRWPALVIASLLGAAVAGGISFILPGLYRAQAAVTISYSETSDVRTINSQTVLLEAIGYSDEVWAPVFRKLTQAGLMNAADDQTVFDQVQLPHPMVGEWRFTVNDSNPERAAAIANAWASSFTEVITTAVGYARLEQQILQANQAVSSEIAALEYRCARFDAERQLVTTTILHLTTLAPDANCEQNVTQLVQSLVSRYEAVEIKPSCKDTNHTASDQLQDLEIIDTYLEIEQQICHSSVEDLRIVLEQGWESAQSTLGETHGLRHDLEITKTSDAQVPRTTEVSLAQFALTGWCLGFLGGLVWIARSELRTVSESGDD